MKQATLRGTNVCVKYTNNKNKMKKKCIFGHDANSEGDGSLTEGFWDNLRWGEAPDIPSYRPSEYPIKIHMCQCPPLAYSKILNVSFP